MPNHCGKKSLVVRLSNEQNQIRLSLARLEAIGKLILASIPLKNTEASFLFVTDKRMKTFNHQFKGLDCATDVLAFSQLEGKPSPDVGTKLLGDVIISVETTKRQAPLYGHSFDRELILYMIHGVLHLLGYDDQLPQERRVMQREEARILSKIVGHFPSLKT